MFAALRAQNPGRSLGSILLYASASWLTRVLCVILYRLRASAGPSRDRRAGPVVVPMDRPLLVVVNHQSFLDPIVVANILPRQVTFLARATLFHNAAFGALIRNLNAVPLKDDGSDTAAIRITLQQLKLGRCVLIFPEGTRTPDGAMRPFKRGVWLLLSRARCDILPIGLDGTFDAFPRGQALPNLWGQHIAIRVGAPVTHAELSALGPDAGLDHLARTVDTLRLQARADIRHATDGTWPPKGPADQPGPVAD